MPRDGAADEYTWAGSQAAHNHSYLAPALLKNLGPAKGRTLLDLGCGNGSLTSVIAASGFVVTGTESATSGISSAREAFPDIRFEEHDISDPLPSDLRGKADIVIAAEVIEHLFLPRELFVRASEALKVGGALFITTPYHGYWKNLALALTNHFDQHWRPSWDYGHIKFFSVKTLASLAAECGFAMVKVDRVGRVPALAKTMIVECRPS